MSSLHLDYNYKYSVTKRERERENVNVKMNVWVQKCWTVYVVMNTYYRPI